MQRVETIERMRGLRAMLPHPVGFVPTMGALHAGHASLVARARRECASVVVSIFVNPLQFGAHEDFQKYPRVLDTDSQMLQRLGADVLFAPQLVEMFPPVKLDASGAAQDRAALAGHTLGATGLIPGSTAAFLEGERRPGHFGGVLTAVLKLLNLVAAHRAYFGRKDAQQLAVVRQMVTDLNLPVEIVACPTVREHDGLAISSRNAYLDAQQRASAARLYAALRNLCERIESGESDVSKAIDHALTLLPPLRYDYMAVVDPARFVPLQRATHKSGLLAVGAAYAGTTRLIDNVEIQTH